MLQRSSEGDYEPYYCLPVNYADGQGTNISLSAHIRYDLL